MESNCFMIGPGIKEIWAIKVDTLTMEHPVGSMNVSTYFWNCLAYYAVTACIYSHRGSPIVPVPLSCCKIAMHGYGVYSKKLSLTEKSPFYRQIYPYSIMWENGTCNKPFCAALFFEISIKFPTIKIFRGSQIGECRGPALGALGLGSDPIHAEPALDWHS